MKYYMIYIYGYWFDLSSTEDSFLVSAFLVIIVDQ